MCLQSEMEKRRWQHREGNTERATRDELVVGEDGQVAWWSVKWEGWWGKANWNPCTEVCRATTATVTTEKGAWGKQQNGNPILWLYVFAYHTSHIYPLALSLGSRNCPFSSLGWRGNKNCVLKGKKNGALETKPDRTPIDPLRSSARLTE